MKDNIFRNEASEEAPNGLLGALDGHKTMIVALANVAAFFVPGFGEWVAANPTQYGTIVSFASLALRVFTTRPVGRLGRKPAVQAYPVSTGNSGQ